MHPSSLYCLIDPSLIASYLTPLQAALAEPGRARLLHRARAINDAHHAANKVEGKTRAERKRKLTAAIHASLKGRVERGEELPQVEVMQTARNAEAKKLAAVAKYVVMNGEGNLPGDLYVELMEYMVPRWDDARNRQ